MSRLFWSLQRRELLLGVAQHRETHRHTVPPPQRRATGRARHQHSARRPGEARSGPVPRKQHCRAAKPQQHAKKHGVEMKQSRGAVAPVATAALQASTKSLRTINANKFAAQRSYRSDAGRAGEGLHVAPSNQKILHVRSDLVPTYKEPHLCSVLVPSSCFPQETRERQAVSIHVHNHSLACCISNCHACARVAGATTAGAADWRLGAEDESAAGQSFHSPLRADVLLPPERTLRTMALRPARQTGPRAWMGGGWRRISLVGGGSMRPPSPRAARRRILLPLLGNAVADEAPRNGRGGRCAPRMPPHGDSAAGDDAADKMTRGAMGVTGPAVLDGTR